MNALSVSALNEQIKTLLESSFERVFVEGELSRITFHNSGHIYFTLKDKDSAISCVMFKGNATKLKFRLEEGLKVLVDGAISVYKPRGSYQINCFMIEPSGQGALALAYEQLKKKLSDKGYFNPEIKKQLPKFPSKIALITSATGAALQDMLRVANKRYRNISIDIYDVLVQGESAAFSIASAIKHADLVGYDLIITGRGGGSIEDLWAFNEEIVADAIFEAKTPIISAVGHEIDYLISDFVADLRAPTPSAAMEMILPDVNELYQYIDSIANQLNQQMNQKVFNKTQELQHLQRSFMQHSVEKKLQQYKENIVSLKNSFEQTIGYKLQNFSAKVKNIQDAYPQTIQNRFSNYKMQIVNLQNMFKSNDPKLKRKKGFAQISQANKVIELKSLKVGEEFEAQSDEIVISAKVLDTRVIS
ncbi:exodeoxyribonuclease VII large subunit [Sulfurimonas sp. C5]|uniref:exodeoxyribonuclease VII large subunit n=1 Tax=Sulfurimonas sp. C5 TaxID=3036947 RepID=UPI002457E211|nr:exodeoxyribonuclease VII large subunit [Sulfurimonas sp. C5]MDH4945345.1 exodeoxyribonuclease VII large subunit [Sulfurimonas sp. C5]